MPIPEGHVALTRATTLSGVTWCVQDVCGYSYHPAEETDDTTALYRVYANGSINLDFRSTLVQDLFCMHCGERLNPDQDVSYGRPDPYNYHCTAYGRNIEIGKEDD